MRLSDIPDMEIKNKQIRLSDIPDEQPKFSGQPGPVSTLLNINQTPEQLAEKGSWVKGGLLKTGEDIYREGISPILSGGSTFAAGVPKMIAKVQGQGENIFPEQTSLPGKLLRGASEIAGFTVGFPGQTAKFAGRGIGKGIEKFAPKFAGKVLAKIIQGAGAGAAGMATGYGDTLKDRAKNALVGGITGGAIAGISPIISSGFKKLGRGLATLSGIEKEVYQEAQQKGFRNVLKSKFYSKKLPVEIQNRIANNIDNMEVIASQQYDDLITPLKKSPFDMPKLKGEVVKIANRVKLNPFDTDVSKLDNAILDGVVNKAQANNLGEALDLRRNLDDIIYSNKGELRSSFGKQVRDLLNKELHQNKGLENVDKEWTAFKEILKEGKKILGDTGEKILERFGNLTEKQKQMMVSLERKIGGIPFIEDLSNYSLAKEFITRKVSPTLYGLIRAGLKPLTRGYLRGGEKAGKFAGQTIKTGKGIVKWMQR